MAPQRILGFKKEILGSMNMTVPSYRPQFASFPGMPPPPLSGIVSWLRFNKLQFQLVSVIFAAIILLII